MRVLDPAYNGECILLPLICVYVSVYVCCEAVGLRCLLTPNVLWKIQKEKREGLQIERERSEMEKEKERKGD